MSENKERKNEINLAENYVSSILYFSFNKIEIFDEML